MSAVPLAKIETIRCAWAEPCIHDVRVDHVMFVPPTAVRRCDWCGAIVGTERPRECLDVS